MAFEICIMSNRIESYKEQFYRLGLAMDDIKRIRMDVLYNYIDEVQSKYNVGYIPMMTDEIRTFFTPDTGDVDDGELIFAVRANAGRIEINTTPSEDMAEPLPDSISMNDDEWFNPDEYGSVDYDEIAEAVDIFVASQYN